VLLQIYERLFERFGPQHWWPADGPFEVIVGAILTQCVSWNNVATAIGNLRRAGLMDPRRLMEADEGTIASLVRPAGYYRQKAKKIRAFLSYLWGRHGGDLASMFATPPDELRSELLAVWGLGPETVDSIMLYAGGIASFVVDAYTSRIMSRIGVVPAGTPYDRVRRMFMDGLPRDAALFNEYHALLVTLGKRACLKTRPRCGECPLSDICGRIGVPRDGDDHSLGAAGREESAEQATAGTRRGLREKRAKKESRGAVPFA
jgi:endonuclease-3 related protein